MADEFDGLTIARQRIAQEAQDRTGSLDLGCLGLTALPEELFHLTHLRRLNLGERTFTAPLTSFGEWMPYEGEVFRGSSAYLSKNRVDLSALVAFPQLEELSVGGTDLESLVPLADLTQLRAINCWGTRIRDLKPLLKLSDLQSFRCDMTPISDLAPLAGLTALKMLDCSWTIISDLGPLAQLRRLQWLSCWGTHVSDLGPLATLSRLQSLDCWATHVRDLGPLAKLSALQSLNCRQTQIDDLEPLAELSMLQSLNFSHCRLTRVPTGFWNKRSLQRVILCETHLRGVPAEVLSQSPIDNCLEALRAHLRDLEKGGVAVPDVKLVALGNSHIGKTQICRRLRGEAYDDAVPSTHGIIVTSASLSGADGEEAAKLHLWDFGGQDIYHGTHALFMQARAIFLLAWTPERERRGEQVQDGMIFRDYPLAYWLHYVRHLAKGSPVLVVQSRCDHSENEAMRPPLPDEMLAGFPFRKIVHYSAKFDRGRATLDDALNQAVAWLTDQDGVVTIGAGRLRVKRRIEAFRDADAALPAEQRRHRTITQERFQQLCDEEGGVSSRDYLLDYLHNAGIVFYRRGLFDDRIIVDQSWALEAVYVVFHRQKCHKQLRQLGGRFTRPLLEALVWEGYKVEEQRLFLSMMRSCGICFIYRHRSDDDEEDEYIAPDLLPDRDDVQGEINARWYPDLPMETVEFEYALLHPGMLRSVISRIGTQAGMTALYWRGGLCVYEQTTGSRALIEQEIDDDVWGGTIRVQTQGGQAAALLANLRALIEKERDRTGTKPIKVTSTSPSRRIAVAEDLAAASAEGDGSRRSPPMQFAQERPTQREYCVSYAWGDPSAQGAEREKIVDQLCVAAQQRGVEVLRDKNVLGLGESISKFMQRIGRGDRVFVVLSEKYLKSPYCMFELFEVWRNCRADPMEFISRVRVYTLPSAQIFTPLDRVQHAIYWTKQYEALDAAVKPHGLGILGEADLKQYKLMQDFSHRVSDILATVADVLQPRSFEELEKHWLDDLQE